MFSFNVAPCNVPSSCWMQLNESVSVFWTWPLKGTRYMFFLSDWPTFRATATIVDEPFGVSVAFQQFACSLVRRHIPIVSQSFVHRQCLLLWRRHLVEVVPFLEFSTNFEFELASPDRQSICSSSRAFVSTDRYHSLGLTRK